MGSRTTSSSFQGQASPLTAVPVPNQSVFIPAPPFAYQISNTPRTVQSLWWQYLYTQDTDYLRRVYPIFRAAVRLLAADAKRGDDGKFHIIPTASPENWGFTVDFRLNKDCLLDLALTQFVLDAGIESSRMLETDRDERMRWQEIRDHLAPYPKGQSAYGEVWLDVCNAPFETVHNVPVTLEPVFPAEQVGIGSARICWTLPGVRRSPFDWKVETILFFNPSFEPAWVFWIWLGSNGKCSIAFSRTAPPTIECARSRDATTTRPILIS